MTTHSLLAPRSRKSRALLLPPPPGPSGLLGVTLLFYNSIKIQRKQIKALCFLNYTHHNGRLKNSGKDINPSISAIHY
jgi:hypothetical protein